MKHKTNKPILQVLKGNTPYRTPIWFMRQAGRYLPEYREVRSKIGNFMKMVLTPDVATEITLQPIKRFDIDAAIIFSDILILPYAMGVDVKFHDGIGPILQYEYSASSMIKNLLSTSDIVFKEVTAKIATTVSMVREYLDINKPNVTTIGFAGAPWTVACYMLEKNRTKGSEFTVALNMMYQYPQQFTELIDILTDATIEYLSAQIDAGAEVVKIFDSWAGILGPEEFEIFVIKPTAKIVKELKSRYPNTPIIGFPRKSGVLYKHFSEKTSVDCVAVDNTLPLEWIRDNIPKNCVIQGNLDNLILTLETEIAKSVIDEKVIKIIDILGPNKFIFNLGHGVVPSTKVENINHLINIIRSIKNNAAEIIT
jgi:uroporphyrinogen decarboxylase